MCFHLSTQSHYLIIKCNKNFSFEFCFSPNWIKISIIKKFNIKKNLSVSYALTKRQNSVIYKSLGRPLHHQRTTLENVFWQSNIRVRPQITSAKGVGWVGSENWQFLLTFSTIHVDVGRVGGSEKVQKCVDVIQGWSLIRLCAFIPNRMPTVVELFGADSRGCRIFSKTFYYSTFILFHGQRLNFDQTFEQY